MELKDLILKHKIYATLKNPLLLCSMHRFMWRLIEKLNAGLLSLTLKMKTLACYSLIVYMPSCSTTVHIKDEMEVHITDKMAVHITRQFI